MRAEGGSVSEEGLLSHDPVREYRIVREAVERTIREEVGRGHSFQVGHLVQEEVKECRGNYWDTILICAYAPFFRPGIKYGVPLIPPLIPPERPFPRLGRRNNIKVRFKPKGGIAMKSTGCKFGDP